MPNGWTGGQYSVFRALLGSWLAADCSVLLARGSLTPIALPLVWAGAACGIALAVGWHDRAAAGAAVAIEVAVLAASWPLLDTSRILVVWLLLAHAFEARAPYGSLGAAGRCDPGGGFRVSGILYGATWAGVAAAYGYAGWGLLDEPGRLPLAVLHLAFAPLALSRHARPWIWLAFTLLHASGLSGPAGFGARMLLVHFLLFDPAWIRGRNPHAVETLLYDGTCGLCHRAVRFVLAEDPAGRFRFAPLAERARGEPDSLVVERGDGAELRRSAAVLHVASRLGGLWRVLGALAGLVPRALRDGLYDRVAAVRYRLFDRPPEACPLVPPELRSRFVVTDPGTAPRDRTTR